MSISVGEVCAQYTSNKGTDFWIGYTDHIDGSGSNMKLYITSEVATEGTVSIPGQSYSQNFSVSANSITQITIPSNLAYVGTSEVIEQRAIHVVSEDDIIVYSHIYSNARSEATMVLPVPALGREYYAMTFEQKSQGSGRRSQFMVIALEDDTEVEITPSQNTIGNNSKGVPFTVFLDSGECYQVQSTMDLTGSKILSVSSSSGVCKKIAVFSGSGFTALGCSSAGTGDNLYEQLYPVSSWGKVFVTSPLKTRNGDWYRVLVSENNTTVTVNGNSGTYNKGDVVDFQNSTANYIVASNPVCVAQFARTQGCDGATGDPFMLIIPPVEQGLDNITLYSSPNQNITGSYINIVIPTAKRTTFKIDNNIVSSWSVVPANTDYSFAQLTVTTGNHVLEADAEFVAQAYGFGTVESYGYVAGSNAKNLIQNISLSSDTVCKGKPVRFAGFAAYTPSSWLWEFGDGDTSHQANPSHLYQDTGVYTVTLVTTKNNGNDCNSKDSTSFLLEVSSSPTANFIFDAGCSNQPVQFTDQSTPGQASEIFKWEWQLEDTNVAYTKNPSYTFSDGGNFAVKLIAFNKSYCSDTITKLVTLKYSPHTKFNDDDLCFEDTAHFVDSSYINGGHTITGRKWSFGDGKASNLESVSHYYDNPGVYDIKLIEYSNSGCNDTLVTPVRKYPKLLADFTAKSVCSPDSVRFINKALPDTGGIYTWIWNFGDGTTDTVSKDSFYAPTHYYANYGSYNVTLEVFNEIGCISTLTKEVRVNHYPKANFSINNSCENEIIEFTDNSTLAVGKITKWEWDYGDGNNSSNQNPKHDYSNFGNYNIKLIVTSQYGCTDTLIKSHKVNAAPVIDFTADTVCFGNDVVFQNNTSVGEGTITKWTWDFGNGFGSSDKNPTYRYKDTFAHNVTLTAETDQGCVETLKKSYRVHQLPQVSFDAENTCINKTMYFNNTSYITQGTIATIQWSLGDGITSDKNSPELKYSDPGDKLVRLTVISDQGCVDLEEKVIKIHPKPDLSFRAEDECIGDETEFINQSTILTGVILKYSWDFGDGATSTDKVPKHTFDSPDTYKITMSGRSDMGCVDTITRKIVVSPYPTPAMTVSKTQSCIPAVVNFSGLNSSVDTGSIDKWDWKLINAGDTSASDFDWTFNKAGMYTVILKVTTNKGCASVDTFLNVLTVLPSPVTDFSMDPDSLSSLNPIVNFTNLSETGTSSYWTFGDRGVSSLLNPVHEYPDTGTYEVTLEVTNSNGCKGYKTKYIHVYPDYSIFIPTGFSPNGDSLNDIFKPLGVFTGVSYYEMTIFNRWGEVIFHTNDINEGWNGRTDNIGERAPTGAYVYIIDIEGYNQKTTHLKGLIYITR